MKKYALIVFSTAMMLGLSTPAVMASDSSSSVKIDADHGVVVDGAHGIHIDHDGDVVIENDAGDKARITSSGALIIDGKSIPVTAQQKVTLLEYAGAVKDMENHAMKLGMDAAGFAIDVVGDVFADLLSGEDEDEIDRHANARAKEFKQKALPICQDVRSLKRLQDELSVDIQSFKPYAVIAGKDAVDCEHDINSDD